MTENDEVESAPEAPSDAVDATPAAEAKPKKKRKTVKSLEKELADVQERLLRGHADFDNYRKRVQRDMAELRRHTQIGTIEEILPVLDQFAMAMDAVNNSDDVDMLKQGMNMIRDEFEKRLQGLGVVRQQTDGEPFDPNLHDAVSTEASDSVPADCIIRTWKAGFMFGERLLRPASVVVSSGPANE